jgi:pimeloyl-ACP methyl ester carboxylesterase
MEVAPDQAPLDLPDLRPTPEETVVDAAQAAHNRQEIARTADAAKWKSTDWELFLLRIEAQIPYAEFARPGTPSALTLLAGRPRLVVTRTMSKAFALAGGRLGYLAADPALVDALRLVRMPYHLSTQTQAVALAALAHADLMLETVGVIKEQRDRIVTGLTELGLDPVPSDANFVLFGGLDPFGPEPSRHAASLFRRSSAELVELPGCGHLGWLECEEPFLDVVRRFLLGLQPGASTPRGTGPTGSHGQTTPE